MSACCTHTWVMAFKVVCIPSLVLSESECDLEEGAADPHSDRSEKRRMRLMGLNILGFVCLIKETSQQYDRVKH